MLSDLLSKEELQKLYNDGLSFVQIAAEYNSSGTSVHRLMRLYDIKTRTPTEIAIVKRSKIGTDQKNMSNLL